MSKWEFTSEMQGWFNVDRKIDQCNLGFAKIQHLFFFFFTTSFLDKSPLYDIRYISYYIYINSQCTLCSMCKYKS